MNFFLLFLNKTYVLGTQKNPQHILKLMGKKIITIATNPYLDLCVCVNVVTSLNWISQNKFKYISKSSLCILFVLQYTVTGFFSEKHVPTSS